MKHKTISILLLLAAMTASAQIDEKNNDAVFLEINKIYTLNPDGRSRFDYMHKVKLLTNQAVNRQMGETFVVFNPQYQQLVVDKSVTTMADEKQVNSPANAFNDVLPEAVNNAPDYAYLIERVISHTGLEKNCTIELQYHIDTKAGFLPWLWGEELFATQYPISKMNVTVRVPKGVRLYHEFFNAAVQPVINTEAGFTRYTWSRENQPALLAEDRHQEYGEFAPRLIFSTCPSWDELRRYIVDDLQNKLRLDENYRKILLKNNNAIDGLNKLLQIRKTVAEEIGTTSLDPAWLGYRFDAVQRVVERNYGQGIEKAALFLSLVHSSGFAADLALLSRYRQFAHDVPTLVQFNRALADVSMDSMDQMLFSVTEEQNRLINDEFPGFYILHLKDGAPPAPLGANGNDGICLRAKLQMDEKFSITGEITIEASGYFLPFLQLSSANGQIAFAQSIAKKILSSDDLDKVSVQFLDQKKAVIHAQFRSEGFFKKITDRNWRECVGIKSVSDDWRFFPYLTTRVTPMSLPAQLNEETEIELSGPDSLHWETPTKPIVYKNEAGEVSINVMVDKNTIHYYRSIHCYERIYLPEHYADIKMIFRHLQDQNTRIFYIHSK